MRPHLVFRSHLVCGTGELLQFEAFRASFRCRRFIQLAHSLRHGFTHGQLRHALPVPLDPIAVPGPAELCGLHDWHSRSADDSLASPSLGASKPLRSLRPRS